MIPAIAAQMMNGSGGGREAFVDFVNGVYSINGATVTAADVIDNPSRVGVDGLFINSNEEDGTVGIIGGLLTRLLELNWTLVLEVEMLDADFAARLLGMRNGDDFFQINRRDSGDSLAMLVQDVAFSFRENLDTTGYGIGIHKIAVTMTPTLLATSVDGNGAVSDTNPMAVTSLVDAAFGDYFGETFATNDFYVRSLNIIDPVEAAGLPALSAL